MNNLSPKKEYKDAKFIIDYNDKLGEGQFSQVFSGKMMSKSSYLSK